MEIKIHPHVSLVVGHKNFFFNKSKAHFETVFFSPVSGFRAENATIQFNTYLFL